MISYPLVGRVQLKPGREEFLARRHPWVYRGALVHPVLPAGAVEVVSWEGERLGVALTGEPAGSLALRMVAWGEQPWAPETLAERLRAAAAWRANLILDSEAYRLVHAEGDELPGLVIDRYGEWAVVELFMPTWQAYLPDIGRCLMEELGLAGVLVRQGAEVNSLAGTLPPVPLPVREGRWVLLADLFGGQKTGLFLDQRDNRRLVAALAGGRRVLNLFCYTGAFGVAARVGGAVQVRNVDSSAAALELARRTYLANGLVPVEGELVRGDAFAVVAELAAAGEQFDLVIVDPPAFVTHRAQLAKGLRGYRAVNRLAMQVAAPGALLLTCSCSALVSEQQFAEVLLTAALESGRRVTVFERRGAGCDHPVSLFCPESRHLKAWLCGVEAPGAGPCNFSADGV